MSHDEVLAFLSRLPARTAKLATTRADGRPHVAPVWFDLDGSTMVFNTGADTIKGRNLRRDGRVAICVDDEVPPFTFVTIQGTAELSEDPDELLTWATRIGGRYMGADVAEEYGRRNGVPGELVVRVPLDHVTAVSDLTA
jgi:PPOX class probable F420-dependent enzyme